MIYALIGLILGFLGSMPIAGPIAVLILHKGLRAKHDEGMSIAYGAAIPETMYCAMALFGFDILFARYPAIESASKVLGGMILLVLGILFMYIRPQAESSRQHTVKPERKAAPFFIGFSIAALNPTLIVTWSGAVAVLYSMAGRLEGYEKVMFPLGAGIGKLLWFAVLLFLVKRYRAHFSQVAINRTIGLLGGAIALFGLWMLSSAVKGYL